MKNEGPCKFKFYRDQNLFRPSLLSIFLCLAMSVPVVSQNLGNGFFDHGVATPNSNHRGIVATTDGNGRNVALVWLFDHRGGYALLIISSN